MGFGRRNGCTRVMDHFEQIFEKGAMEIMTFGIYPRSDVHHLFQTKGIECHHSEASIIGLFVGS